MAGPEERYLVIYQRLAKVEISDIIGDPTDRCVKVRVKRTGKIACLPRSLTQFSRGTAFVPEWLAAKICPAPAGGAQGVDTPDAESGAGQ